MDQHATLKGIGKKIRGYRAALEVSQEAFADAIGMHRAYYSAIERGEKNVTVGTLLRIAKGLRVPLKRLVP